MKELLFVHSGFLTVEGWHFFVLCDDNKTNIFAGSTKVVAIYFTMGPFFIGKPC